MSGQGSREVNFYITGRPDSTGGAPDSVAPITALQTQLRCINEPLFSSSAQREALKCVCHA